MCVALVAVATVAAATEEGLAAAAEKDEKIALLTLKATKLEKKTAKLEAAVDAMKTLSPETKRQVAVELSAAKSCVATDPKASCELLADTGAPPAKPESNLGEPLQARIERAVQQYLGESLKPHTKKMIIKMVKAEVGSQCARRSGSVLASVKGVLAANNPNPHVCDKNDRVGWPPRCV